ncbi:3-oxoacyl-[acyl-carrier-protein] reductase isoform X6 [Mauremys mutica]|uniref:3-oxoacyl-[acyl-carrier-protein] reductase isoform X6 n=2 Tax=Mauremys mutica TaxID=74926 RepID=UPI001D161333|nr:3-oxoacyl-[acyl-carrier-protein] reductase isoform X6 [Mauremys mutica]
MMAKVCAIFGGSRGIGKAVAQLLAWKGYRLAIIARNLEVAQTTVNHLGAGHMALSCDVAMEQDVQNTLQEVEKNLGHVNYLVNAAGVNRDGLLLRTTSEDMVSQINTNLLGTMLTCKAAVRHMLQQQGGAIVNIGSIVGLKGNSGQSVYSASKAGLVGFSRSLAKEVARKKIRVNMVAPGDILWLCDIYDVTETLSLVDNSETIAKSPVAPYRLTDVLEHEFSWVNTHFVVMVLLKVDGLQNPVC